MGIGYNLPRWRRLRRLHLQQHPLCVMCKAIGRITPAVVVDHIRPHKGDTQLFWDASNIQGLCQQHHDGSKQQIERTGYCRDVGADGWPIDRAHPVYRRSRGGGGA
jgi:5-methylcytosine-specific restriction protein A